MAKLRPLTKTEFFSTVKPYLRVELYGRDKSSRTGEPRARIELGSRMPMRLRLEAIDFTCGCVRCGATIHPFRCREVRGQTFPGHVYVAVTCPLHVSIGCSRSGAARDEYSRIREAVAELAGGETPRQLELFK